MRQIKWDMARFWAEAGSVFAPRQRRPHSENTKAKKAKHYRNFTIHTTTTSAACSHQSSI